MANDVLRMLEQLHEIAVDRPRQFLGLTWKYDPDDVSQQILKIRASLPQEIKQAANISRESERIVETARDDASATIEGARREADRLIEEAKQEVFRLIEQGRIQQERLLLDSEILKLAKAQSEEIRNQAERDAAALRRGGENYAYDVLSQLEGVVGKVMTTIERGKAEIHREDSKPALAGPREKARVL